MQQLVVFEDLPSKLPDLYRELSGQTGTYRHQGTCYIPAGNDYQAIKCWLEQYQHPNSSPNTFLAYRKELERLLLWSWLICQKPLSSLDQADYSAYFDFLANPQPKELWCNTEKKSYPRTSPKWRPFAGPLNYKSIQTSRIIINHCLNYLVKARYLDFNPLSLVRVSGRLQLDNLERKFEIQTRILGLDEWQQMQLCLRNWQGNSQQPLLEKLRLQLIVGLLFCTSLRVSELVNLNWNDMRLMHNQWWLVIIGKGNKLGTVPINNSCKLLIQKYRLALGQPALPPAIHGPTALASSNAADQQPVLVSLHTRQRLTRQFIGQELKKLALRTAEQLACPQAKLRLSKFSPHWLRHLSASLQSQLGINKQIIKENLRHNSINTTELYIHSNDLLRHEELQKLELAF